MSYRGFHHNKDGPVPFMMRWYSWVGTANRQLCL